MDASTPPFLTHGEWVMAILTATYVGITGFYAWVSHRTLKAIQDQAESNRAQFKEQLKVARDAAAAAQQNAQAIINAERAWVHGMNTVRKCANHIRYVMLWLVGWIRIRD